MQANMFTTIWSKMRPTVKDTDVVLEQPRHEYSQLTDEEICARTDRTNPKCVFYGLIGQDNAIADLLPILSGALSNPNHDVDLNAMLFIGPPSVGKTLFAKRLSKGLEIPLLETTSDQIDSADDLFVMMQSVLKESGLDLLKLGQRAGKDVYRCPNLTVFIDEFHQLTKSMMEALLKPLEADDAMLLTQWAYVDVSHVLFIGGTTNRGDLARKAKALDSRFVKINFQSYTTDEIAAIVKSRNKNWSLEDCRAIAIRSGRLARQALQLVKTVDLRFKYLKLHKVSDKRLDAITQVCDSMGIDNEGMSREQLAILGELSRNLKGLNYQQLSRIANVAVDELKEFILPPLQSETIERAACVQWNGQRTLIRSQGVRELKKRGLIQKKDWDRLRSELTDL